MDLAKIRKKSLHSSQESGDIPTVAVTSAPMVVSDPSPNFSETVPLPHVSADSDPLQKVLSSTPVESAVSVLPHIVATHPERVVSRTPLEAILGGRAAAGCDDKFVINDDNCSQIETESFMEFLCFRVSDEIYGINIMDIKEIVKPRVVTEVPRAPRYVQGVLSLRGTIILIIDMRIRLGLASKEPTGKERIVVIKNNNSFCGLLVDEVIQVVQVQLDSVEAPPAVLDGIDRDFVNGLCRSDGKLIIILDLKNITDIDMC